VSIHKTGQHRFDDPTIQAFGFEWLFRVTENSWSTGSPTPARKSWCVARTRGGT